MLRYSFSALTKKGDIFACRDRLVRAILQSVVKAVYKFEKFKAKRDGMTRDKDNP
jgi:hypothetical protein